jgi:glycosyltransferase 2 family protein
MVDPSTSTPATASAAEESPTPRDGPRVGCFLLAKVTLLTVVLIFVVQALAEGFRAIPWSEVTFRPLFVALAVAGMMVSKGLGFFTYAALMGDDGRAVGWRVLLAATWVPPLGKYIPGKVASVAWAILLLNARHVPAAVVIRTVFLQGVLGIIVGLTVAAPLVLEHPEHFGSLGWVGCLALVAAGLVMLHPWVLFRLMNWTLRRLRRPPLETAVSLKAYVLAALTVLGQWIALGSAGWFIACAIQADDATIVSPADLPLLISATALANCVGFLALFAPAGLGVREGILLASLRWGGLTLWSASIVVAATRIIQVALELVLAGAGYLLLRSAGPPAPRPTGPGR